MSADVRKAKINYSYFCTPTKSDGKKLENWNELKGIISSRFSQCWFDDDSDDIAECMELKQIETARNFLYGDGLPFNVNRALIDDFSLKHSFVNITYDSIMLTYFSEENILSFTLNLNVEDVSMSDLVYLRQVFCDNPVFSINRENTKVKADGSTFEASGTYGIGSWAALLVEKDSDDVSALRISVESFFKSIMRLLELEVTDIDNACVIELNDLKNFDNVYEAEAEEKNFLYGLLTGDEGWMFVPDDIVNDRVNNQWGTREFVRFYNFGTGSVMLNLSDTDSFRAYVERQEFYGGKYYGGINPYFIVNPTISGVAHGALFSLETVLVIKVITRRIYARQESYKGEAREGTSAALKQTKQYRHDLMIALRKIEKISIDEMGELENVLLKTQFVETLIDKLKYLLELLESEIDLMYQENTNRMVTILTVIGLLLSALEVLTGFI